MRRRIFVKGGGNRTFKWSVLLFQSMKEQKINTGKLHLNYIETTGDGTPLLLLHGGSSRWQTFSSIISDLDKVAHVYALDLRGHGKSDRGNDYKIQSYVEDVVMFIEKHIQKPTVIFGHSLGGMVGIMLAAKHPSLVKGLIIGDSPFEAGILEPDKKDNAAMVWKEIIENSESAEEIAEALKTTKVQVPGKKGYVEAQELFGADSPYFEFMGVSLSQNDPMMLKSVTDKVDENFVDYQMEKLFPEIKCPVLVLQGDPEHGGLITDEDIDRAKKLLPSAQYYKCKNIGHGLYLEDKDQVVEQMLSFMKGIES